MVVSKSFLAPVDIIICLYTSAILMPASAFILSTTVRQVSLDEIHDAITFYVLGVKVATSFLGITTSVLAHNCAMFWPKKLVCWILMIMGIISSFGSMMSLSTIFFKSNWHNHIDAMRHIMFLTAEIIVMITSMILSVRLALRFKDRTLASVINPCDSYVTISSVLLAALLLIASCTVFIGFIIGVYINSRLLRESTVAGGGLYSGFLGILTSIIFLSSIKMCKPKIQRTLYPICLILGVLDFLSAVTSFYTEEMELAATIKYISNNKSIFLDYMHYKILLLSKSTLIELSSLFMSIFTCPLLVSCYILAFKGTIDNQLPSATSNGNDYLMSKYEIKFGNPTQDGVLKQSMHLDSLEISAMTATTSGINVEFDDR